MNQQEFRTAVGTVAQNCAMLEHVVAIIAHGLTGVPQDVGKVALPNAMDGMLGTIKSLLPMRVADPDLQQRVLNWCGEVRVAYTGRSTVLHSMWIPLQSGEHWRVSLKPLKGEVEHKTVDDIYALAQQLQDLATDKVGEFMVDLVTSAPGPWSAGLSRTQPPATA